MLRRLRPYLFGLAGVGLLSVAIAVLHASTIPNVSLVYLVLVLWLGANYGSGPAVAASVFAFLAYDFFFVEPVGTLTVNTPSQLLALLLLLTAAMVTGGLASSQRATLDVAARAEASTRDLYEIATAALKLPTVEAALELVASRATRVAFVRRFAIAALSGSDLVTLAGPALGPADETSARWTYTNRTAIGARFDNGNVRLVSPAATGAEWTAVLPLTNGVILMKLAGEPEGDRDLATLSALVSLAGLLLDRWVVARDAEQLQVLEASDRLKSSVLSSLSHELKTPIAVLRTGLSSLALPQAGLGANERDLVNDLDREAEHLDRLIENLLTMSRLDAGRTFDLQEHSLPEIVGAVVARLRRRLEDRRVVVSVPQDLPPVRIDDLQVSQVLTNLLTNAVEWSPSGGRIEVGARLRDGEVMVFVDNEGPHVPPVELKDIFARSWTRRPGGTGFGLSISKAIVEAHGGQIRAQNRRDGMRFSFSLPLQPSPLRA